MLALKIWGTAQLMNALIFSILFQGIGLIISGYCLVAGVPAILLFAICIWLVGKLNLNNVPKILFLIVCLSLCTAACAYGLVVYMNEPNLFGFAIVPIVFTIISTLTFNKSITAPPQTTPDDIEYY